MINVSDEFRKLAEKKCPDKPGRVIGIVSGKGGVGKTSISSLLSYGIASTGLSVLVMDMDTGLRNLDTVMGVDNRVVRNLFDVLERNESFENAAIRALDIGPKGVKYTSRVPYICLSDQLKIKNAISVEHFQELLKDLRDIFDVIILDAPAGIEYGCRLVTESVDEAYIVCTPEMPSLRSVDQIINIFEGRAPLSLIVNRVITNLISIGGGMDLDNIKLFTNLQIAAVIPFDAGVIAYGHTGSPLWFLDESPAKQAMKEFIDKTFKEPEPAEETPQEQEQDNAAAAEKSDATIDGGETKETAEPKPVKLSWWKRLFGGSNAKAKDKAKDKDKDKDKDKAKDTDKDKDKDKDKAEDTKSTEAQAEGETNEDNSAEEQATEKAQAAE